MSISDDLKSQHLKLNYAFSRPKYLLPYLSSDNLIMHSPLKEVVLSEDSSSNQLSTSEITPCEIDKKSVSFSSKTTMLENVKNNVSVGEDDFETDFKVKKPVFTESKNDCDQRSKNNINESFICVVCRNDLTNLNLEERVVHVNQCIDSHSSAELSTSSVPSEAFILECPLCFKSFPTPEVRSSHIKKCGKSRGLSVQSVIQALQLQEKHVLERRALGLPLHKVKQSKKTTVKKFTIEPKSTMQSDLQLARALSLSLKNEESQSQQSVFSSVRNDDDLSIHLQPPTESQVPGRSVSAKRRKLNHTPLLLLRTEEERHKIILDKVNAIIAPLFPDEIESNPLIKEADGLSQECTNNVCEKVSFLWDLSSKAENRNTYYVDQLIDWITPSDVEAGSKICNLSQIPGHRIFTQLPCDYTFSNDNEENDCENSSENNQSSSSLIGSLKSLIGNSWMSDVDIHTASGIVIPAHRLLLAVRCPILKNEFDLSNQVERHVLDWKNTSFEAALHFLNFIYTGSTEWKEDIVEELTSLAEKYNVTDLFNILNSDCGTLELMLIENSQMEITNFETKNSNILKDKIENAKEAALTLNQQEILTNSAVKCSDNFSPFNLKQSNLNNDAVNQTYLKAKSISICDDILESLKSNTQYSNSSDSKGNISINNDHTPLVNKACEVYDVESSSSNDSCKIVHVNNTLINPHKKSLYSDTTNVLDINNSLLEEKEYTHIKYDYGWVNNNCSEKNEVNSTLEQKSYQIYFENEDTMKTSITKGESPVTSPVKSFLASNIDAKVNCSEEVAIEDFQKQEAKKRKTDDSDYVKCSSLSPKHNYNLNSHSNFTTASATYEHAKIPIISDEIKFQNSDMYSISHVKNKLNEPLKSPFKVSTTTGIDSIPYFPNDSIYDYNAVESNCFALDQNRKDLDNRDIKSPEIFVCDSDEELNIQSSPYSACEPEKNNVFSHLHTSIKPNDSVPEIITFDSDKDEEQHNVLPINNLDSYDVLNKCLDFEMHNSNHEDAIENNENICESQKVVPHSPNTWNKLSMDDSIPVVIHFDSEEEEEDVSNRTLPLVKSNDENDVTPLDVKSDNENDVIQLINAKRDKFIEIPNSVKKCETSDTKAEEWNHLDFSPLAYHSHSEVKFNFLQSENTKDLQILSPDSPWVFKKKTSLEDFKTPSNLLKTFEKSDCIVDEIPVNSKLKKDKCIPSQKENKKKCNSNSNLSTPTRVLQQFKLSDSPITPFPDFNNMVTPEIKEALRKIGVKALPRKKAVAVLSHVYEETHPWTGGIQSAESHLNSQPVSKLSIQKKSKPITQKRKRTKEMSDISSPKSSVTSPAKKLSEDNSFSSPESNTKQSNMKNCSFSSDFSDNSQPECKEKTQLVSDFILNNEEIYKQILNYLPLNLVKFQEELKNNGISISMKGLMDFLDEQCITFHYPRKEEYKKKQQLRTQRFRKRMIAKLSQQTQSNTS